MLWQPQQLAKGIRIRKFKKIDAPPKGGASEEIS